MTKLRNVWKRIRLEALTILFILGYGLFILLTLVFFIPVLIYRCFVQILAKCCRPDLTHLLQSGNNVFALERIHEKSKTTIVVPIIFDKPFPIEEFQRTFQTQVLEKRKEGSQSGNDNKKPGDLIYPELKQTWTEFLGYQFWKNEPNFKIEEHIRYCDFVDSDGYKLPEICDEDDIKELCTRLLSTPWKKDFSPWEFYYIPNYVDKKSSSGSGSDKNEEAGETNVTNRKCVLLNRFHHAMGDGKGWLEIGLRDCLQMKDMSLPKINLEKRSMWDLILSPIKMPYDFAKVFVESIDSENSWHRRSKRNKKYYSAVSSSTPVQLIKDIKNKFGVGYNAVLISAISGAIRRVMLEAGQKIPKKMMSFVVLPLSGHPGGICIHATAVFTRWPIGTADPLVRLGQVFEDMKKKQNSFHPITFYFVMKYAYLFPTLLGRLYYNKATCTLAATLFPGPMATPKYMGCSILDTTFYIGLPSGQIGAGIATIVVGGKQRISVTIDNSLFPSNEIFQKLGGFIDDELQILQQASPEAFRRQFENIV